jgi:hypothetical protein
MKDVDRTYRDSPDKFTKDLTKKITTDSAEKMGEWESKGRLPLWMRVKNRFSSKKTTLRDDRS